MAAFLAFVALITISSMRQSLKLNLTFTSILPQVSEYEKDLAECRLLISQHEARMQTLTESMKEAETRKRALEEDVDALREECAKLKAAEQVQAVTNKEKAEEKEAATKMRVALEEQMDQLRDAHQRQVSYSERDLADHDLFPVYQFTRHVETCS